MKYLLKKHKHLPFEERREIQECLEHGVSFKAIAARIGKGPNHRFQGSKEAYHGKASPKRRHY